MMAETSSIEWTDATWNPITGCSVVSPGCTNCYAMRLAGTRLKHHSSRAGLTAETKTGPVWTGEVRLNEDWLYQPLGWGRPRMIFVCAHGDLFHESVPDEWIDRVFVVMGLSPRHTFQVLTKRPERMRAYIDQACDRIGATLIRSERGDAYIGSLRVMGALSGTPWWPLANVWLGVSAEDQARADERIPHLLATPAAIRFVSAEPLLGPIDFQKLFWPQSCGCREHVPTLNAFDATVYCAGCCEGPESLDLGVIDWVIVGGESGRGARPMRSDWPRSIRDQCADSGVPFFMKQMSGTAKANMPPIPADLMIREMPASSSRAQRGDPAGGPSAGPAEGSAAR